jgi:hypothetical protein
LIKSVCGYAGSFLDDICRAARRSGIPQAVEEHDTARIFEWLVVAFNFQGISDQVARNYLRKHGAVTWQQITADLEDSPACPLTASYGQFEGCRYDKGSFTCSHPDLIERCPLPRHPLRNGRLNQTAYSLYLFIRDIAPGGAAFAVRCRRQVARQSLPGISGYRARSRAARVVF